MELTLLTYLSGNLGQMPIGPLILAELARKRGCTVRVADLPPVKEEELLAHKLAHVQVVGLSTISTTFHRSLHLAERIKALNSQVTIIMGGPQATTVAREVLEYTRAVDMIFHGEAEESWDAFLAGEPLSRIPGLCFREHGRVVENPRGSYVMDLDRLPMPAFDLYPPTSPNLAIPLETGRGCPFLCTYCSTNRYFSRNFRAKSPARILAEMDYLHNLYHATSFDLIHDNFNTDPRRTLAFCAALRNHRHRYSWSISARPDRITPELVSQLQEAGCKRIYFGMESGSPRMQRLIRKNLRLEPALANIQQANAAGMGTTVSFIVGFPQETRADLRATLELYTRLSRMRNNLMQLHLLAPLQGSRLVVDGEFALAFDGMPTDFNESDDGWSVAELSRFHDHPQLFPHMFYFVGAEIARERYLFLVYLVRLGWLFFPNFMGLVSRSRGDRWVDFLLNAPLPHALVSDSGFPLPHSKWIGVGGGVLAEFARGVADDGLPWQAVIDFDREYSMVSLVPEAPVGTVKLPRAFVAGRVRRVLPATVAEVDWSDLATFQIRRNGRNHVEVLPVMGGEELEQRMAAICGACGECCLDQRGADCELSGEWQAFAQLMMRLGQELPRSEPAA